MTLPTDAQNRRRTPWYFLTILFFFVLPVLAFLSTQWKQINRRALLKAMLIIMTLGYTWSILVSYAGWWVFNPKTMLGIQVLPYLPLEEALFYPLGGILSVLCYFSLLGRFRVKAFVGKIWFGTMVLLTVLALSAVGVSWAQGNHPYYIVSQIFLYNSLSIAFWFIIREKMFWRPIVATIIFMTIIGFLWNWIAFNLEWWEYHATLGWMWPPNVPVDDWDFYIFAPIAAVSLYCYFDRA